MRGLHSRGPGVNHLLTWASETHTCTILHQNLVGLKIHRQREEGGGETVKEGNGEEKWESKWDKGDVLRDGPG